MPQDVVLRLSKILKLMSRIAAVLLIPYGFMLGILGVAAEGRLNSQGWRFVGLVLLLQGILYLVPNERISVKRKYVILYLAATLLPPATLLVVSLISMVREGLVSFAELGGFTIVAVLLVVSLVAPFSLIFYLKQERSRLS